MVPAEQSWTLQKVFIPLCVSDIAEGGRTIQSILLLFPYVSFTSLKMQFGCQELERVELEWKEKGNWKGMELLRTGTEWLQNSGLSGHCSST